MVNCIMYVESTPSFKLYTSSSGAPLALDVLLVELGFTDDALLAPPVPLVAAVSVVGLAFLFIIFSIFDKIALFDVPVVFVELALLDVFDVPDEDVDFVPLAELMLKEVVRFNALFNTDCTVLSTECRLLTVGRGPLAVVSNTAPGFASKY